MSTTQAPQITREQWAAAFNAAYPLFIAKVEPSKLKEPKAIFNLLVQFARQVGTITEADPTKIYEAVYSQLKAHLLDRNSIGLQDQQAGRGIRMEGLVIQWTVPPKAVTKHFVKPQASWHEEVAEREREAEEHLQYVEYRKKQEYWRSQAPGVISGFEPVRNQRVDHAALQSVTAALQKFLDGYEKTHQEDLQAFERDRTFREWRVNWEGVVARMEEYCNKQYNRVENRTPVSERI